MDFIKTRKIFYVFSGIMILCSFLMIIIFGFKWGIDFTGGSLWEIKAPNLNVQTSQQILFFLNTQEIGQVTTQITNDNSLILRFQNISEEKHQELLNNLKTQIPSLEEKKFDSLGPAIGQELIKKSIWAVILVFAGIFLYLIYAFRHASYDIPSYKYGLLAILALLHDLTVICGFLFLMGKIKGWELNSDFLVALLVVAGYSVHDTIVVYDRIRENLKFNALKVNKGERITLAEIINKSINQTLLRSLNTSLTTLFPLIALYFVGPNSIKILASAMTVGIIVGTYSSIFIASSLLYDWSKK
ncbi:MAG: protein translocase subunit SecF [Candidatus Paceibacterota bacterium]